MPLRDRKAIFAPLFRLVIIERGEWNDGISCRRVNTSLRSNHGYKTLSYPWGLAKSKRPIQLDGSPFVITVNLECALRLLRRTDEDVIMWIDAICINQADTAERESQVGMMRHIYEKAGEVVVYLGDPERHRRKALDRKAASAEKAYFDSKTVEGLDVLQVLQKFQPKHPVDAEAVFEFLSVVRVKGNSEEIVRQINEDKNARFRELFESLRCIATCPWWSRTWVLQEVIVPRNVTLMYGNVIASWDFLFEAVSEFHRYKTIPYEYAKVMEFLARLVRDIDVYRRSWRAHLPPGRVSGDWRLLDILRQFMDRKATDDRDKVFALLGLFRGRTMIRARYYLTVENVYIATTLDILKHDGGSLRVLSGNSLAQNNYNLPSWVIDWSATYGKLDLRQHDPDSYYQASKGFQTWVYTERRDYIEGGSDLSNVLIEKLSKVEESVKELEKNTMGPMMPGRLLFNGLENLKKVVATEMQGMKDLYPGKGDILFPWCPVSTRRGGLGDKGVLIMRGFEIDVVSKVISPIYPLGMASISKEVAWNVLRILKSLGGPLEENQQPGMDFLRALVCDLTYCDGVFARIESQRQLDRLWAWFLSIKSGKGIPEESTAECHDDFDHVFLTANAKRCFFMTREGRFGWGPASVKSGDGVFLLPSGNTPFLLRRNTEPRRIAMVDGYWLVGDCFVQGVMDNGMEDFRSKHEENDRFDTDAIRSSCSAWLEMFKAAQRKPGGALAKGIEMLECFEDLMWKIPFLYEKTPTRIELV
ncbi:heterokaryon incompatibility protein-domain-containing protein [Xylariomycetidae sp. FL2044]|nr:heterokaryon incompatibility protein-domain-containing protein [Xylariomycetidae sp. FL2044]